VAAFLATFLFLTVGGGADTPLGFFLAAFFPGVLAVPRAAVLDAPVADFAFRTITIS
jgi:hypothetical protein